MVIITTNWLSHDYVDELFVMFVITIHDPRGGFAMLRVACVEGQRALGAPFIAVRAPRGPSVCTLLRLGQSKQQGLCLDSSRHDGKEAWRKSITKNPNNSVPLCKFLLNSGLRPFQRQRFLKVQSLGGTEEQLCLKINVLAGKVHSGKKPSFWVAK